MCGIAGAFGADRPDADRIELTLERMRNRGPDAQGVHSERIGPHMVTLLHTRLSIIDLDARANQPMERNGCVLVFNGEIYNYVELRAELESKGHVFETRSDTEVLLEAYLEWGPACVDHFEGMWAFALLNRRDGTLFLSRDPFGEKPLFYMVQDGTLYFGSEAKILPALSGRPLRVNPGHLSRYLVNGYRSLFKQNETFFEGVRELPAASSAVVRTPQELTPEPYWRLEYKPHSMSMGEAIEGVRERVFRATEIRMRADVPVAFCLSGGIDSATLASVAAKHLGQHLHAFSIYDDDPRYDESQNVEIMVESLDCEHHITHTSTDGFFDRLAEQVGYHDAPVPTITWYVHSFLSEAISRNGYTVAISGTGADELLAGYYDHYAFWLAGMHGRPDFDDLVADWRGSYGAWVNNPLLQDPLSFVRNPDARDHIYQNREVFNSLMIEPVEETFAEQFYTDDLLRKRMLNELSHEVVPVLLRADDHNSMKWSVENRSPYMDRPLAEFLSTVPSELLIHNGYPKWLLRSAAAGLVPDEVRLDKRKRGFNAPIDSLIDRNDPETRERLLDRSSIFDFVRRDALERFLAEDLHDNSFSKFMFGFVSAKLFLESDIASGRAGALAAA